MTMHQPREHENDECNAEYPKCRGGHEDAGSFPGWRARPLEARRIDRLVETYLREGLGGAVNGTPVDGLERNLHPVDIAIVFVDSLVWVVPEWRMRIAGPLVQ